MPAEIETTRLAGGPPRPGDVAAMHALYGDPAVAARLYPDGPPPHRGGAARDDRGRPPPARLRAEAAEAAIRACFDVLGLGRVTPRARFDNAASQAVMAALGVRDEREVEHSGDPHRLYRRPR